MPENRDQLVAYLATLGALVFIVLGAMGIAAAVPAVLGKIEVFALGTVFGGLIGVLRMPTRPAATASAAQDDALKTLADKVPPQTGEAAQ